MADPLVHDVQPIRRPNRLDVDVYVLMENGAREPAIIAEIDTLLNADDKRPIQSDFFTHPATILPFHIDLALRYDARRATESVVISTATARLYSLIDYVFRLGQPVTVDMVMSAAIVEGVVDATVQSPLETNPAQNDLRPVPD